MMKELQATLYQNTTAGPVYYGALSNTSNHRILWAYPGGVQQIEFDYATDRTNAFAFMNAHLGYRVTLTDSCLDRPVAEGDIVNVDITVSGVHVIANGIWHRHFDQYYINTPDELWSTSDLIKDAYTNYCPAVSTSQAGIQETDTVIGFWQPPSEGIYPGDLIQTMMSVSDTDNRQWNYWVGSQNFHATEMQKPMAYLEPQNTTADINWQVWMSDIKSDTIAISRNIEQLANDVQVVFTMVAATTSSNPETWQAITTAGTDTESQTDYWTREAHVSGGNLPEDSAGSEHSSIAVQMRDLYLDKFKEPTLNAEFTIGSTAIKDNIGAGWPLWTPIKYNGGYLRLNDVLPDTVLFDTRFDRLRTGQIMELEYSEEDRSLRIRLDTENNALDALLARQDLFSG